MTGGGWQLQSTLTVSGQNRLSNTTAPVALALNPIATQSLPYGTGPGSASIDTFNSYTLAAGASLTLNLFDGTMLDMSGAVANFRLLRGYAIWISSGGDTAGVTIGGAASNPHPLFFADTSDLKTVYPGGQPDGGGGNTITGVAVTATVCNVKILNNGAAPVTVAVSFAGTQCVSGVGMGVFGLTYP